MGKQKNFLSYYEEYKDKIFTYLWYRVDFQQHIAEDLTADIFLKALKNFDAYDPDRSFQAWIYAIARNHLADYYHKSAREVTVECLEDFNQESFVDLSAGLDDKMEAERIIQAINKLGQYHREVLLLRYVDDLSNSEIAAIMGKEEGAVRVQISRALRELRKKLSTNE